MIKITNFERQIGKPFEEGRTNYNVISGEFEGSGGWSFIAIETAIFGPEFNTDCWVSPVLETITFYKDGEPSYTCPGDDYDGHFADDEIDRLGLVDLIDDVTQPSRTDSRAMMAAWRLEELAIGKTAFEFLRGQFPNNTDGQYLRGLKRYIDDVKPQ